MNELFVMSVGLFLFIVLFWGFRNLPKEEWQIIGTIPGRYNKEKKVWEGVNLTYYGFFQANSYLLGLLLSISLLGSIQVSVSAILMIVSMILAVCIPASSLVAKIVEKKSYTFTVGGAAFTGILIGPPVCLLVSWLSARYTGTDLDVLPVISVLAIGYTLGEGFGRLACISFGCCYGRALSESPAWMQRLFGKYHFVFTGKNKKISYADHLEDEAVIPIQAITSALYCASAVFGTWLFLNQHYYLSFVLMILITQVWRFLSEFFRADYRGEAKITAYQIMGIVGCIYSVIVPLLIPSAAAHQPDIIAGLKSLWNPVIIFSLQVLWIGVFLYTGRSNVTGATLSFFIHEDRI